MSLIQSPLWSLDARKTISKSIIFSKTKNRKYVKSYVIPKNPRTLKQTRFRQLFKDVSKLYKSQALTQYDHLAFSLASKILNPQATPRNMMFYFYLSNRRPFAPGLIYDVIVTPPGSPFEVECFHFHPLTTTLVFVKGPHTGHSYLSSPGPPFLSRFSIPFREPDDYFQIFSDQLPEFAYTGFYPYDYNWWI